MQAAFANADTVYHCASRVGDFGSWRAFQAEVVEATQNAMTACRHAGVQRVLHVSSVAVYGHRPKFPPGGPTKEHPLPSKPRFGDHYGMAKLLAEEIARAIFPTVTIVRPTWVFGPRDRHGITRLVKALRGGWVSIVGSGENPLNIVHASDIAAGAILAATHPAACNQTYNLCSNGEVTQRQFLDALADAEGVPRITRRVPVRLAYWGGFLSEMIARGLRFRRAPYISRYTVSRLCRPITYNTEKATNELAWRPKVPVLEGLRQTLAWLREAEQVPPPKFIKLDKMGNVR